MHRHHSHDARKTLTAVDLALRRQNKVREAAVAERLFAAEQYDECADMCYEVLKAVPIPSEAIQAKCHMFLATEAVAPDEPSTRA